MPFSSEHLASTPAPRTAGLWCQPWQLWGPSSAWCHQKPFLWGLRPAAGENEPKQLLQTSQRCAVIKKKRVGDPHLPLQHTALTSFPPLPSNWGHFPVRLLAFAASPQLPETHSSFSFCKAFSSVVGPWELLWQASCVTNASTWPQSVFPAVHLLLPEFLSGYLSSGVRLLMVTLSHVAGRHNTTEINFDTCKGISPRHFIHRKQWKWVFNCILSVFLPLP